MKIRDYQSAAVDFLLPRGRAFIIAPAGSGKTVMAAAGGSRVVDQFDRVVWLANTMEQCEQARAACLKFKWPDPITIDVHCVAARPNIAGAALVIIDESHHLPARSWWSTAANATCRVWGFSATPWSGDWERDGILKAFFGEDNFYTVPRSVVRDGGGITRGEVFVHDIDEAKEFDSEIDALAAEETKRRFAKHPYIPKDEHMRRARWLFTAEAIRNNANRNAKIVDLANEGKAILVLVSTIEHGELLKAAINGAQFVHAKIGKKNRAQAIEDFRNGALRCMIATSLADEGLDVPRAATLILAAGGRSAGKLEQRTGRVMRPHDDKEIGTVHDFADKGASLAYSQFRSRMKTYKKLGYKIHG